jgi:hypothetical protein
MSEKHARHLLREACEKHGSMASWAKANGISLGYVSDVLKGNRLVGSKIADALGLERVVRYRKVEAVPAQTIGTWFDHLRDKSGDQ